MAIHALFLAINDYPGSGMDLRGCVNDAHDWQAVVVPHSDTVYSLCDSGATRERILLYISEVLRRLNKPDDWAIIQNSGHGSWLVDQSGDEPDGRDEVLCPYDYRNPILDDEIHDLFKSRKAGRVLFITDSCHSGTVFRYGLMGLGDDRPRARFMPPEKFVEGESVFRQAKMVARTARIPNKQQFKLPGVIHFAGCQDTEYCYDASFDGRPNGAFTYAALKALGTLKPGATFHQWYRAIREYLPSPEYPQKPKSNAAKEDLKLPIPWMV